MTRDIEVWQGRKNITQGKDVLSWLVEESSGSSQSCPRGQPILNNTTQQCSLWTCTNKAPNKVVRRKKVMLETDEQNERSAQSNSKQDFTFREVKGMDWCCFNTSDLVQVPLWVMVKPPLTSPCETNLLQSTLLTLPLKGEANSYGLAC